MITGIIFMLCAFALGGFIVFIKGVFSQSYIMMYGGWGVATVIAVFLALWFMTGYCPIYLC